MDKPVQQPSSFADIPEPFAELASTYLDAMLARKEKDARESVMNTIAGGASVKDIYLNVFQPVMYEIGRLWQTGAISVGQEHYCTNATQLSMAMLYPQLFTGSRNGKRMLAACVQDELHELGLRMVTDFFEMDGWDTDYLGANTPQESIVQAIEEKEAQVLAIGVTMHYHLEKAKKIIDAVRSAAGTAKITILVGGYTCRVNDTIWQMLGADGSAGNAHDAIELAEKLTQKGA